MSIVSTDQVPGHASGPLFSRSWCCIRATWRVRTTAARTGCFVVDDLDAGGLSAEPALVSAVCKETDLPVRAMLRLNDTYTTTGGELTRLVGLGEDYLAVGAEGVSFGFLTPT